jgi:hypothetical protein
LPSRISPINRTGKVQSWYLFEVSEGFSKALISHLDSRGIPIPTAPTSYPEPGRSDTLGDREQERIEKDADTPETEKEALIKARKGQGRFRENVFEVEKQCRVTRVTHWSYLRASHIWPWRYCSNRERLDGNNGLILAPNIDWVFDQGYISFRCNGRVVISAAADLESLEAFGIHADLNVGPFSVEQEAYLRKHRAGDKALGHPSVLRRKDSRGA